MEVGVVVSIVCALVVVPLSVVSKMNFSKASSKAESNVENLSKHVVQYLSIESRSPSISNAKNHIAEALKGRSFLSIRSRRPNLTPSYEKIVFFLECCERTVGLLNDLDMPARGDSGGYETYWHKQVADAMEPSLKSVIDTLLSSDGEFRGSSVDNILRERLVKAGRPFMLDASDRAPK